MRISDWSSDVCSSDLNGNPLPDASIVGDDAGNLYAGEYVFNSPQDLQDWVNLAFFYNIPITGPSSGSHRLSCSWDGTTLSCSYKRILSLHWRLYARHQYMAPVSSIVSDTMCRITRFSV